MRIGGVAGGRVVQRRADSQRDRVAGIFDQIDDIAVVQPRYVVMVDGQDAVADVQLEAPLGRTVRNDLADERDSFRHRRDDDEAETFVFPPNDRHIVRVNHSTSVSYSARISCIFCQKIKS